MAARPVVPRTAAVAKAAVEMAVPAGLPAGPTRGGSRQLRPSPPRRRGRREVVEVGRFRLAPGSLGPTGGEALRQIQNLQPEAAMFHNDPQPQKPTSSSACRVATTFMQGSSNTGTNMQWQRDFRSTRAATAKSAFHPAVELLEVLCRRDASTSPCAVPARLPPHSCGSSRNCRATHTTSSHRILPHGEGARLE